MTAIFCQPPWLSWFKNLDSDDVIRQAAYQPVVPIVALSSLEIYDACQKLQDAWDNVFVASPQHVEILRSMIGRATSISSSRHPTLKDFNRQLSDKLKPVESIPSIRCLTGLGGVSKSSLVKAFERICSLENGSLVSEGQRLTLRPVRRIGIHGEQSVRGVLETLANPVALSSTTLRDNKDLMEHLRQWLTATATCCLILDEMQFFTRSSAASTKTSQLIMAAGSLGVPVIFVANYSLVHKLKQRPQEEKDRLLASPFVLHPPAETEASWAEAVNEYIKVSPECFKIGTPEDIKELHQLTAGLFRALGKILSQAYFEAVKGGQSFVTMKEVRLAYSSSAFSESRKDIEDLISISLSRTLTRERPDLVCPFDARIHAQAPATSPKKIVQQPQFSSGDISALLIEGSLNQRASAQLAKFREAADSAVNENKKSKVVPLPKRVKASAKSLLDGTQLFLKTMDHPTVQKRQSQSEFERPSDENAN